MNRDITRELRSYYQYPGLCLLWNPTPWFPRDTRLPFPSATVGAGGPGGWWSRAKCGAGTGPVPERRRSKSWWAYSAHVGSRTRTPFRGLYHCCVSPTVQSWTLSRARVRPRLFQKQQRLADPRSAQRGIPTFLLVNKYEIFYSLLLLAVRFLNKPR